MIESEVKTVEIPLPLQGESIAIRETRRKLETAAGTDWPALLLGESGTGKQVAAEWLHTLSPRSKGPFVEANTACWNGNTMVHSVLFGHEKGAFTGATSKRIGLFERASRGTLFLDEIGELDLEVQPMLLKVLDQGKIEPLGAGGCRVVNTRLVCATNRNLGAEAQENRFRKDLLARIETLSIRLPSLSERLKDLDDLWRGICRKHSIEVPFSEETRERVAAGELVDNLRGLERVAIRTAVWGLEHFT